MSGIRHLVLLRSPYAIAQIKRMNTSSYYGYSSGLARRASSTSTSSSLSDPSQPTKSARSKFKEIPVNPSILKYIQNIGVGIPKRIDKKRRRRRGTQKGAVLSHAEELERFGRDRRRPPGSTTPPPPFAASSQQGRGSNGRSDNTIIRYPVRMIYSAGSISEGFPQLATEIPEVALAGRSNVGKSTLLNALLYGNHMVNRGGDDESASPSRRKRKGRTGKTAKLPRGLKAITSPKPGETRRVTFYKLASRVVDQKVSLILVDLPGYGFAYASDEGALEYKSLMESYILERGSSLKRLLLLIDARHGMKMTDIEFLESLQQDNTTPESREGGRKQKKPQRKLPPIQIVLTKCDLVPQKDIARRVTLVKQQLSDCLRRQTGNVPVMMVSAQMEGRAGVLELQKELASLVPKPTTRRNSKPTGQESRGKPQKPV